MTDSLDRYYTPPALARRIAEWADVDGSTVLEPSCGNGALVLAAQAEGATVTAFDIEHTGESFLDQRPERPYQVVLMNPPYSRGQDLAHIEHALLFAPRVVALVRLAFLAGKKRFERLYSEYGLRRAVVLSQRPLFSGPDSAGMTPKHDYAVIEMVHGCIPSAGLETWGERWS